MEVTEKSRNAGMTPLEVSNCLITFPSPPATCRPC